MSTENQNDEGGKGLIRGTVAKGYTFIAALLSLAATLADRGDPKGAEQVARKVGAGDPMGALADGAEFLAASLFPDVTDRKYVDTDGKQVYVGLHPFRAGMIGVYRSELLEQVQANRAAEQALEERKNTRAAEQAKRAQEKANKAAEQAKKLIAKAEAARKAADEYAKKTGIDLDAFKAESDAEAETDAALSPNPEPVEASV